MSLAWPRLRPASYRRWRVPALVAVRLLLILMPINFSTEVFDAMALQLANGRLAWLTNISPFLMGEAGAGAACWACSATRGPP